MKFRNFRAAMVASVLTAALMAPWVGAAAADIELKAIGAYARGNTWTVPYERMIEKVNKENKVGITIKYLGGNETMHPFEVGNAVKNGVVDMANVTGSYYARLLPEALTLVWSTMNIHEIRASSAWPYISKVYADKMNTILLAQLDMSPVMLWLRSKKLSKPDLTGLKMRGNPLFRPFLEAMGATVVTMPMNEIYTAMERGVLDGFGYPMVGMEELGLHKFTKYRLEPSISRGPTDILVNLKTWKSLNNAQRKYLQDMGLWLEKENDRNLAASIAKSLGIQTKAGITTIMFDDAYVRKIHDVGWAQIIKQSPTHGPALKKMLVK